jgi:hypothetical protein
MKQKDELIRAYTGTEITVILLKGRLEEIGISSVIQNDYKSGINVGFVGGVQSAVDLYIQQSDYKKAQPVINEFIERNKV